MIIRSLLSCIFCTFLLHSSELIQTSSSEESEEAEVELLETPKDPIMNEDEELSLLPKKGQRPQVVHIPTKAAFSP